MHRWLTMYICKVFHYDSLYKFVLGSLCIILVPLHSVFGDGQGIVDSISFALLLGIWTLKMVCIDHNFYCLST